MNWLSPIDVTTEIDVARFGGKAAMLCRLRQRGFLTPAGFGLPVAVYQDFLTQTGLDALLAMELERKDFKEMRWEEIWDVALRIRNHFVAVEWPRDLHEKLSEDLRQAVGGWEAVAVRSTAPSEDGVRQSFAGLHESRIMLRDIDEILAAIRVVWASLWSDRALLYRKELGLDPASSGMAVLIQEMITGDASGVLFTRAPQDSKVMMVEAVWGLNQALVDGSVTPSRCQIDRVSGRVTEEVSGAQTAALWPASHGAETRPLDEARRERSPLDKALCQDLFRLGLQLEEHLGGPQDLEWTWSKQNLYILQARPVTATLQQPGDDRPWYLSLHRSLDNLEALQQELEEHTLPGMETDAKLMAEVDLPELTNRELVAEHARRCRVLDGWLQTYKEKCIPMAHGIRLFGEYYNDHLAPADPYAFIRLLQSDHLLAVERNRKLTALAERLRNDQQLWPAVKSGQTLPSGHPIRGMLLDLEKEFGGIMWVLDNDLDLATWLVKLAEKPPQHILPQTDSATEEEAFFAQLPAGEHALAARILDVARASYRLRDNDNLYLGKIRAAVVAVEQEINRRVAAGRPEGLSDLNLSQGGHDTLFARYQDPADDEPGAVMQSAARQLVGQPAGPGFSSGPARVLDRRSAIHDFNQGEVLVCDAIEPNMTFLAPLAAAIIERRGGMLIHGAIIAREYGIPCVTGIPEATRVIRTGDQLTVDGFLGIVTIDRTSD